MKRLLSIFFLFVLFSCSNVDRLDTKAVKQEMNKYKIKKITKADILNQLNVEGQKVKSALLKTPCNQNMIDSLSKDKSLEILFLDLKENRPELPTKLKAVFEAYQYANVNNESMSDNFQQLNDSLFTYTFWAKQNPCGSGDATIISLTFNQAYLIQSM